MGRHSMVLLLTLAVLLQPAFAAVCMAQCPMSVQMKSVAPATGAHFGHAHHHGSTVADHSLSFSSSGACDKKIDLRSSALVSPTVTPAFTTSAVVAFEAPAQAVFIHSRVGHGAARFNAPIVVPLRI